MSNIEELEKSVYGINGIEKVSFRDQSKLKSYHVCYYNGRRLGLIEMDAETPAIATKQFKNTYSNWQFVAIRDLKR